MKKLVFGSLLTFVLFSAYSQDLTKFKLYKPEENAKKEIEKSVEEAKKNRETCAGTGWGQLVYLVCPVQ